MVFIGLYALSFGLDVIDGPVARALGQSTKFGAALDMLTGGQKMKKSITTTSD